MVIEFLQQPGLRHTLLVLRRIAADFPHELNNFRTDAVELVQLFPVVHTVHRVLE